MIHISPHPSRLPEYRERVENSEITCIKFLTVNKRVRKSSGFLPGTGNRIGGQGGRRIGGHLVS